MGTVSCMERILAMNSTLLLVLVASFPVFFQQDVASKVKKALKHHSYEPACSEVVKKAVAFSKNEKKAKIPSTKTLRASALLPLFRFSVTKNMEYDESFNLLEADDSTLKIYTDDDLKLKFTVQWDLAALVFNSSETSVIAKEQAEAKWLMEIKKTVVEIYHFRKKLQVLLYLTSDALPLETAVEWSLKLEELTAMLDALTGDWFSHEVKKRKKKKK